MKNSIEYTDTSYEQNSGGNRRFSGGFKLLMYSILPLIFIEYVTSFILHKFSIQVRAQNVITAD